MSFDLERASSSALWAMSEVSRILFLAVTKKQKFTVDVKAGMQNEPNSHGHMAVDGSWEVSIKVDPLPQQQEPLQVPATTECLPVSTTVAESSQGHEPADATA